LREFRNRRGNKRGGAGLINYPLQGGEYDKGTYFPPVIYLDDGFMKYGW